MASEITPPARPGAITETELAAALARRHPDKPRDSAESLARALFADVGCCRPEPVILPAGDPLTPEQLAEFRERFEAAVANGGASFARQLVAQAEAADAEYKVAAVRAGLYTFLHRHGRSALPEFEVAIDLAVSLRKIVDDLSDEEPGDGD
jgi:hypothetical protein